MGRKSAAAIMSVCAALSCSTDFEYVDLESDEYDEYVNLRGYKVEKDAVPTLQAAAIYLTNPEYVQETDGSVSILFKEKDDEQCRAAVEKKLESVLVCADVDYNKLVTRSEAQTLFQRWWKRAISIAERGRLGISRDEYLRIMQTHQELREAFEQYERHQ